jgi:hypothetical protein
VRLSKSKDGLFLYLMFFIYVFFYFSHGFLVFFFCLISMSPQGGHLGLYLALVFLGIFCFLEYLIIVLKGITTKPL